VGGGQGEAHAGLRGSAGRGTGADPPVSVLSRPSRVAAGPPCLRPCGWTQRERSANCCCSPAGEEQRTQLNGASRLNGRGQLNRRRPPGLVGRAVKSATARHSARRGAVDARRLAQATEPLGQASTPRCQRQAGVGGMASRPLWSSPTRCRQPCARFTAACTDLHSRARTAHTARGPAAAASHGTLPATAESWAKPPRPTACLLSANCRPDSPSTDSSLLIAGQMHQHAAAPPPTGSGTERPGAARHAVPRLERGGLAPPGPRDPRVSHRPHQRAACWAGSAGQTGCARQDSNLQPSDP